MIFVDCFIKVHSNSENTVIGVCDKEVLGRTLRSGIYCYQVSEAFFKGKLIPIEEAIEVLKKSHNFNAVGKNIIAELLKNKIIHPEGTLEIEGVPIALRFVV
jgi:uncharacterized protein